MCNQFERLLAVYCSPTLAGIKPASLMACGFGVPVPVEPYRCAFSPRGIEFATVHTVDGRCLLLVYHRKLMEQRLSDPAVGEALEGFGYPGREGYAVKLERLISKLESGGCFPHEIGLFLGYPVEDVLGFIRNKGKECKLCGYWKVYGDAEAANLEFKRLSRVCHAVTRRVEHGEPLLKVFAAA